MFRRSLGENSLSPSMASLNMFFVILPALTPDLSEYEDSVNKKLAGGAELPRSYNKAHGIMSNKESSAAV